MDPRDAFARRILEEHGQRLRRFLASRGVPARELDDLLQEVVARACDVMEAYDPSRDLGAWVITIASNQAGMFLRRPYVREEQLTLASDLPEAIDVGSAPEELMIRRDRLAMLDKMLASMPTGQRDVVIEYEIKEVSMPDVAKENGLTLGEAWSRWKAGVDRCRGWFQRWQAGERAKGRDGVPIVLLPMFSMTETVRRALGRRRLAALTGRISMDRGLMKAVVALCALGCMSPDSSIIATVKPLVLPELSAISTVVPDLHSPAPRPAPAIAPPVRALALPPRLPTAPVRRAAPDDLEAAELMVLQAEAEHQAGNNAEAVDLLLEHSERRTTEGAAAKRNRLLREIDGQ